MKKDTKNKPMIFTESDGQKVARFKIEGMRCAACASRIEEFFNKQQEVYAKVSIADEMLTLRWRGEDERADDLQNRAAAELGYKLSPFVVGTELKEHNKREEKFLLSGVLLSGLASLLLMSVQHLPAFHDAVLIKLICVLLALPVIAYAGTTFFRSAWSALRAGRTNMDVPISVAIILTTLISLFEVVSGGKGAYVDSVTMLQFFLLIGRYLDHKARGKARSAAIDLLSVTSGTARVIEAGEIRNMPISALRAGMLLQISAGESIPADGIVEEGRTEVDTSFITGETISQLVCPGNIVLGGMVNILSPITVRLTEATNSSLLGEIIKLMEKAEQGRAVFVRFADKVARLYTPVVHVLALASFVLSFFWMGRDWQSALLCAVSVLIVTCPCAVGLAVPAVQVLTSGRLFRSGVLLKSADALERLAFVDTVIFDKTGTLTKGKPRLTNPANIGSRNMQIAASLAARSRHTLAKALYDNYGGKILDLDVAEFAGQGLEAKYDGRLIRLGSRTWCGDLEAPIDEAMELWLHIENEAPVRFAFIDDLRADAQAEVEKLKQKGYRVLLFSGDREQAVSKIAADLGIDEFAAGMLPSDKAKAIEEIKSNGGKILMVGDGLNDAPALAMADVSMSPSSALDITQNAADIVFQGDRLYPVSEALYLSKRSDILVRQNLVMSLVYNLLAVPFAMIGAVTPITAAIAMSLSSIAVVMNSYRVVR